MSGFSGFHELDAVLRRIRCMIGVGLCYYLCVQNLNLKQELEITMKSQSSLRQWQDPSSYKIVSVLNIASNGHFPSRVSRALLLYRPFAPIEGIHCPWC